MFEFVKVFANVVFIVMLLHSIILERYLSKMMMNLVDACKSETTLFSCGSSNFNNIHMK